MDSLVMHQVFANGTEGYACFRIPSLVRLDNGDLLAVAEGRVSNCGDHGGVIRLVGKISQDSGQSWRPLCVIARNVVADGSEHVAQNACPVVDLMDPAHPDGKIIMLFNTAEAGSALVAEGHTVRRIFAIESTDQGRTWTGERDITAQVHHPLNPAYTAVHSDAATRYSDSADWRDHFPPVGHAIQLRGGLSNRPETRGRLFFASYVTVGPLSIYRGQNYAIWSDDHGASWRHSEPSPVIGVNEAMAVELEDGNVLVNFRNYTTPDGASKLVRGEMVYTFDDQGRIQPPPSYRDSILPMPATGVQASIHRYSWRDQRELGGRSRLLFSGPDSTTARERMTVWLSEDEGLTWPTHRLIDAGPGAYSDLAVLPDHRIGLLYEQGNRGGIAFTAFDLDWLINGSIAGQFMDG